MSYSLRAVCAFVGGVLAGCGLVTAAAVIVGVHPESYRWTLSQAASGVGVGLVALSRVRDDDSLV